MRVRALFRYKVLKAQEAVLCPISQLCEPDCIRLRDFLEIPIEQIL